MKSIVSFFLLWSIKVASRLFYRFRVGWPDEKIAWDEIKLVILLNHTSLFEFLYLGILPTSFLRKLSKCMVVPGADKTLNRPIVGSFFKLFSAGMISITRKRDDSWEQFLDSIYEDSVILIAPEGRMKRKNGLDLEAKKMNVRSGVVDILNSLEKGKMLIGYSGGLHHVQVPGEGFPRLFKTLFIDLEVLDIPEYKTRFALTGGNENWKKLALDDLQRRLETKIPD